ncbi:hypothetical protein EWM64_g4923 [Hericium alpestre]|uniref:Uncharacterized protein n=1 Tax=Hericium alpestre TaxID=135208 RepID=A0A4Y9ZW25_9AGAM|nr:hypothetical protein EWM64_g4923 [Hericium alpestre]
MLARGTLTHQDLNLQLYGSQLPNLGPNFDSAEDLLGHVQQHEVFNVAAATFSMPLTSYQAYRDPYTKDDRRIAHEFEDMYDAERAITQDSDETPDYELDFQEQEDLDLELEGDDVDALASEGQAVPIVSNDLEDEDPFAPENLPWSGTGEDDGLAFIFLVLLAMSSWRPSLVY